MQSDSPAVAVWLLVCDLAVTLSRVSVPTVDLVERTGFDVEAIETALVDLAGSGLVATWDDGSGPVATLTPLAAARLGLKLRRFEGRGGLEWMPASRPDPKERRRAGRVVAASSLGLDLDRLAGSDSEPSDIVAASEAVERLAPARGRRLADRVYLPAPTVTLTGCRTWPDGWPGRVGDDGRCSACRGARLSSSVYCLVCDRWGLDWLVAILRERDRREETEKRRAAKARRLEDRHSVGAAVKVVG
jgi:hypothetical protein